MIGVACSDGGSGDGSAGKVTYVGTVSDVATKHLAISIRCTNGQTVTTNIKRLEVADSVTVEIPVGGYAAGGGHVAVGRLADLSRPEYQPWLWEIAVDDNRVTQIQPWFVEGCRK